MRILVVEDNGITGITLAEYLKSNGVKAEVEWATSGESALTKAAVLKPNVLILDYFLPDMTGRTLLEELRAKGVDAPVVLLTAAGKGDFPQIEKGPWNRVLRKPCPISDVIAAVKELWLNGVVERAER